MFDDIRAAIEAVVAKVKAAIDSVEKAVMFYFDVAVGVLAVGEIATGYISTLLGPDLGPRVAAGILLVNLVRTVARTRRKDDETDDTDTAGA